MAKLLPNGKLSGSIGNITYSPQPNGDVVAREKPAGAAEKILYNENCVRSRENFTEFGRAVSGAALVRYSLDNLIKGYALADRNLSGRFNKIVVAVAKSDHTSKRGERRICQGQLEMLQSFAFREEKEQAFDKIFRAPITQRLDPITGTATLQLAPCRLKRYLKAVKNTTHIRLIVQVASLQFDQQEFNTECTASPYLPIVNTMHAPLTISTTVAVLPASILLTAIGVVFYAQQADGTFAELPGGVMAIGDVQKSAENTAVLPASSHASAPPRSTATATSEAANPGGLPPSAACAAQALVIPVRKADRRFCSACQVPIWLTTGVADNKETVDTIREHVQQQSDRNDTCLTRKQQQNVHANRIIAVQGMETNAAAAGVEDRHSQQVIEVDEHGQQQYHIDPKPPRTVDQQGYENRETEVQEVMNDLLHAWQNYG
nr:hypothetical protein [Paraflavitalea sp. H1-2-19X]